MRTIPILQTDGSIDACATGIIQAHMMYPDDQASIDDDIDSFRARARRGHPKTAMRALMHEQWKNTAKSGGIHSGLILYKLAVFSDRSDLKMSINKAVFMTELKLKFLAKKSGKKDRNTIMKNWSQFKNSSHLWAALLALSRETPISQVNFLSLVSVAEQLRLKTAKMVKGWDPWLPPATFETTPFDVGGPDDDDLRLLATYRAPVAL